VAAVLVLMALLFAKVWQSTAASTLSMERDRLRREVRVLENRIRLSSELRVQAALREGLDHRALASLGFQNPDPSAVVNIEPGDVAPSGTRGRDGVAARFGSFLRGVQGRSPRRDEELHALPVSSSDPSAAAADGGAR
jgi:hypothetical protein